MDGMLEQIDRRPLQGELAAWPLLEILTWAHVGGRTATIRVGMGLEGGVIFLRSGQIYRAEWGGYTGEQAVLGLVTQAQGMYMILQRAIDSDRNVGTETAQLLQICSNALQQYQQQRRSIA